MINNVKNFFRMFRQTILHLRILETTPFVINSNSILIIAPHPDDETFGCGGLITQKIQSNANISILFLTNGEKSLHSVPKAELKQMRRACAINAAKLLGVNSNNLHWMDLPDGSVPRLGTQEFNSTRDNLLKLIHTLQIDEVFATHYLDGWSDHIAAYELALAALKKSDKHIELYLYWVWVWYYLGMKQIVSLPWNKIFLLPIHSVFDKKQKALEVYFDAKIPAGDPYMGNLPKMFLKAFDWPYEVFEKVEYK
jgi:LmbE family N-acetylglucosaminyl deacetylase